MGAVKRQDAGRAIPKPGQVGNQRACSEGRQVVLTNNPYKLVAGEAGSGAGKEAARANSQVRCPGRCRGHDTTN